jgi:hypothetical protein
LTPVGKTGKKGTDFHAAIAAPSEGGKRGLAPFSFFENSACPPFTYSPLRLQISALFKCKKIASPLLALYLRPTMEVRY